MLGLVLWLTLTEQMQCTGCKRLSQYMFIIIITVIIINNYFFFNISNKTMLCCKQKLIPQVCPASPI